QYQNRLGTFDYDMIIGKLKNSLSPGNEQINRWASVSRNLKGSFNFAGTSNPAIDAMIKAILDARSDAEFIAAVRALDRILISGSYYIPLYHVPEQWVA
ncbi:MAG: ABC transporter substrate-binding protein, partial [Bartonella sp.]|nr:ABC transporter substrate-binding protein [Bartonella sp.]